MSKTGIICPSCKCVVEVPEATAELQDHDNLLIAERDREWLLALADLGVAGKADSVRNGSISVVKDEEEKS
jgi:hypothetical protein